MVKQQIDGKEDRKNSKDQTPAEYDLEVKQDLKKENQTTHYRLIGLKNKTILNHSYNISFQKLIHFGRF